MASDKGNSWIDDGLLYNRIEGTPKIFFLKPIDVNVLNEGKIKIFHYGSPNTCKDINILLLGESGSGKTSLINSMVNYIAGTKFQDEYRIQLDDVHHDPYNKISSDETIVYKIYFHDGSRLDYNLNIIDSPGLSHDKHTVASIIKLMNYQIATIHAACLVINSTLARLTSDLKQVLDHVSTILRDKISNKTIILCTHALNATSPVTKTLNEYESSLKENESLIRDSSHFYFENEPIEGNQNWSEFSENYFKANEKNFELFFKIFGNLSTEIEKCCSSKTVESMNKKETFEEKISKVKIRKSKDKCVSPSHEIIAHLDLKVSQRKEPWMIYSLPLVETTAKDEKLLSRKIKIFETTNTVFSTSKSIFVLGSSQLQRMKMIELLSNFFMNIQPEEFIWFRISSDHPESAKDNWIHVYKLHPMCNAQSNYLLKIFDIPVPQSKNEKLAESLDEQINFLISNQQISYIDEIFYMVDNLSRELNHPPDFHPLITVCSFEIDKKSLKEKFPEFERHEAFKIFDGETSDKSVKSGFQILKRNFENKEINDRERTQDCQKLLQKRERRNTFQKDIASAKRDIENIRADIKSVSQIIREKEREKHDNENYKQTRSERKSVRPKNKVVNCQNCKITCCFEHHNDSYIPWSSQSTCNNCVVTKKENCKKCECPYDHHNKSSSVQYTDELEETTSYIIPEKKMAFEKANVEIESLQKELSNLKNREQDALKKLKTLQKKSEN